MTYGTSYFVSRAAAVRYYRDYEGSDAPAAVARKLREGSIHIGKPALKPGERLWRIDGGLRYAISNPGRKAPTKAQKRANASKRSKLKRVAKALKTYLAQQNPGMKLAGAAIQKLKGGVIKITPIKANAAGKCAVCGESKAAHKGRRMGHSYISGGTHFRDLKTGAYRRKAK